VPAASRASLSGATQPPTLVGRYAIHGKIASGGMATVHIGRLVGSVGFARTVAIKRLHPHLAQDRDFVLMFIDEARIAARIRHTNVVPTLDVVAAGEELLLVMEYVPGESLSRLMHLATAAGQGAPPRIAAAVSSGVLHGLHAAHEARDEAGKPLEIVHRDVSPQNVLVGIDGVARLLDFGVATAIGRVQSTRGGALKGKMSYMAPERVRGDTADRRSDIYAASVLLWETLTGKRLFRGDDETQILAQVIKGWSEPPSAHAPSLGTAFDAVVMRGLALEPAQRFATAAEMARELEACVGLATPAEVGEWVQAMAGDPLRERAYVISRMESQSGSMPGATTGVLAASDVPDAETSVSDVHLSQSRPSASGPISNRMRLAALSPPPAMRAALKVTMPAGPALIVAALAIAAGIVIATVLALRPHATPAAPSAPVSAQAPVPPVPADPAAASAPTVDIAELPPAADSAPTTTHPPGPPARVSPPVPAPAPPAPKPRANCDPPYVYDADGLKHYKRECN
jgi:serine/threonine protein kinase